MVVHLKIRSNYYLENAGLKRDMIFEWMVITVNRSILVFSRIKVLLILRVATGGLVCRLVGIMMKISY